MLRLKLSVVDDADHGEIVSMSVSVPQLEIEKLPRGRLPSLLAAMAWELSATVHQAPGERQGDILV
jgi:DNA-binding IclR family transcriptional regulator